MKKALVLFFLLGCSALYAQGIPTIPGQTRSDHRCPDEWSAQTVRSCLDIVYAYRTIEPEPHYTVTPEGWAVGNGFVPGVTFAIDGQMMAVPFSRRRVNDICRVAHIWLWKCDDEQPRTCGLGDFSKECQGYTMPIDVTGRFETGWHAVQALAGDARTLIIGVSNTWSFCFNGCQ